MRILILSMRILINCYNFFMIIAQRIKELRRDCGMTQYELAKKVGCSQSMVVRWEKEECEPTAGSILALSYAFDCSCDYLLGKSDF